MVKQRNQLFVALLTIADAVVIAIASYLAWGVRLALFEQTQSQSLARMHPEYYFAAPLLLYSIPIVLYFLWLSGLYRPRRDRSLWGELKKVVQTSVVAVGAMVVVMWLFGSQLIQSDSQVLTAQVMGLSLSPAKIQLGSLALFLPVALCAHRAAFRITLRRLRSKGWNQRHAVVIGVGRLGQITHRTIARNSWTGINVSYFISHHPQRKREQCLGKPVVGGLDDLEDILESRKVDAIYIAIPTARSAVMPDLLRRLERYSVDVRIVPDFPPRFLAQGMAINELEGMPILTYRESPLYGLGGFGKRLIDIAGAFIAILIFGLPMLLVALAVRLSGPGPVLFRQQRVSLGGDQFSIYKFRTMHHIKDEADPSWTRRDDPRITPIGRLLRAASLDELPQLFNVLIGDMSLVGPRPERPELIQRFRDDWRGYMLRQHVKAGITGWAQVNGLRGDTSLKKRLQHDLYYIRHWSLGFDLKILWMTLRFGFIHRNAH